MNQQMKASLGGAGLAAGGNILTAGLNFLFGRANMKKQHEYNKEETEHNLGLQHQYNEASADAADRRQRKLFEDYMTYEAQKRMMREAGLNPALMYGMNGASGSSMPSAAQASGVGAGVGGVGLPNVQMADLGNTIASARLMEAEANKANADADSTRGKDGTKGAYEIKKLVEETKVATQQALLGEIENKWAGIMKDGQIRLMESQISAAFNNYQLGLKQLEHQAKELNLKTRQFREGRRQFDISHTQRVKEFREQRIQFQKRLDAEEARLDSQISLAVNSQIAEHTFKSEQAAKQFKHDMKKAWMNIVGGMTETATSALLWSAGIPNIKSSNNKRSYDGTYTTTYY